MLITTNTIPIIRTKNSLISSFDFENITFGKQPTDHMFIAEYKDGEWQNPRIEPFHNLSISPMALCFHYGQTIFEGFKAFKMKDGNINVFRAYNHAERINKSLHRMCMPAIPEDLFIEATHNLVKLEKDWVPNKENASLYLRPFVIATEPKLGVKVSEEYIFMIVCSPMASYYAKNLKVKVETKYSRAVQGGTGEAKCGGNYGAAFYPTQLAKEEGFDQVLWTDAIQHEFIEESGTMNAMFIIDNVIITPSLDGSLLAGITRDSIITIAKDHGMKIEERRISYHELEEAFLSEKKVEAFGIGTAAVIAPIEIIGINGKEYFPYVKDDAKMFVLKSLLQDIRIGTSEDTHQWNYVIKI